MCLGSIYPLPDMRLLTIAGKVVALRQLVVTQLTASRALRDAERASEVWPTTLGLLDVMRHQLHLLTREIGVAREEVLDMLYDLRPHLTGRDAERCATLRACLEDASMAWGMDTSDLTAISITSATRVADVVNDVLWRYTDTRPMPNDHDEIM